MVSPDKDYAKAHNPVGIEKTRRLALSKGDAHPSKLATTKAKIGAANSRIQLSKGKHHSSKRPEVRAAMSALRSTPEHLARQSKIMKAQRATMSGIESSLLMALDKRIFKYTGLENKDYGQPISADIIAPKSKLIVQVDGCYWHECPKHGSGKFPNKPTRDKVMTKLAQRAGWTVLRFWEHEINEDVDRVVARIMRTYAKV